MTNWYDSIVNTVKDAIEAVYIKKEDVGESAFSNDYEDLDNRPTNVSEFTNDAGYLTQHQDISGKADKLFIENPVIDYACELYQVIEIVNNDYYEDGDWGFSNYRSIDDPNLMNDILLSDNLESPIYDVVVDHYGILPASIFSQPRPVLVVITDSWCIPDNSEYYFYISYVNNDYQVKYLGKDITLLSPVAYSNSYNDLDNKPTIPTNTNQLTNGAGFLTSHQDISGKAPNNHKSTATTYGVGDSSNYGHLKLSASTSSSNGVSNGVAATPSAVKAAYNLADGKPTLAQVFNAVYPVGAIYMSVNSTSPATLFGGEWEQLQNRFLLGAGSSYTAGNTGGEASHTLTTNEMPSHAHGFTVGGRAIIVDATSSTLFTNGFGTGSHFNGKNVSSGTPSNTGGGGAHNNMPPYLVVYMWKRTKLA